MVGVFRVAAAGLAVATSLFTCPAFAAEPSNASIEAVVDSEPALVEQAPADRSDVPLAIVGKVGSRSVVVNPKIANQAVAAFVTGSTCYVRVSTNGGTSWNPSKKLQLPAGAQICNAPTLLWSTDGTRVYAAYFYRVNDDSGIMKSGGIAIIFSLNHGVTWSSPIKAIDVPDVNGPPTFGDFAYDRIFLAMPLREKETNHLYLLGENHLVEGVGYDFARSSDRGLTWTPQKFLTGYDAPGGDFGEAISGGFGGAILVTVGHVDDVVKQVVALRSSDYGKTFTRSVIAPNVETFDTDVAFGFDGSAHVVYNEMSGLRVRYTQSRAPYTSWSAPVTLGSDIIGPGTAIASPSLTAVKCGSHSLLNVVWMSNWEGPNNYNVYYTRKLTGNGPWSDSLRISDNPVAQGDRAEPGIAVAANKAVAAWGSGVYGNPFAVWSSRVAPGVTCP